jgi:hypothetical protein
MVLSFCLIQSLYSQNNSTTGSSQANKQIRIKLGALEKTSAKKEMNSAELQQLAYNMEAQALQLRKALRNNPSLTEELLKDAENLENTAALLQIDAFEISGRLNRAHFNANRLEINALLLRSNFDEDVYQPVTLLITLSEREMKMATEMREEANAEKKPAVKLGRLSNADEKETLALNEQDKALGILKKNKSLTLGEN